MRAGRPELEALRHGIRLCDQQTTMLGFSYYAEDTEEGYEEDATQSSRRTSEKTKLRGGASRR